MPTFRTVPRRARGSLIADAPLAIWILLIGLCFPLLNMATISLRSNFLTTAARDAASAAAKARSFNTPVDANSPSARQVASWQVSATAGSFSEVSVTSVTTYIASINIASGVTSRQTTPLAWPADTTQNIYAIEVEVRGQVNPLFTYNGQFFGNIPGFTAPIDMTSVAREFCEFPQGLTL